MVDLPEPDSPVRNSTSPRSDRRPSHPAQLAGDGRRGEPRRDRGAGVEQVAELVGGQVLLLGAGLDQRSGRHTSARGS